MRSTLTVTFFGAMVGCMRPSGGTGEEKELQTDKTSISTDNGSWGNGSWGNGSWGNGSWGNGSWGNGSWGNGTWGNGSWGNGTWGNGSWGNGTWGNGSWGNGTWGNGTWGNGTWGNGTWGNGTWGNGSWGNGSWGNGSWGNGLNFSTLSVGTLDYSNLVDAALTGSACDSSPDRSAAFTELMVYTVAIQCALPASCVEGDEACMSAINCGTDANCRVITDCEGNELYVGGQEGLGSNNADVDACIDSKLAELNLEWRVYANNLNQYAVSCALPPSTGASCANDPGCVDVTYQIYPSGTETKQYYGGIGLAPTWKSNPYFDQDPLGQRRVSACLASRTNPERKTVQLSIRGLGIPVNDLEKHVYIQHEGAFWGNLFAETPKMYTCTVSGGGISGRICTGNSESCDFVDAGPCASVCASQDSDGSYRDCLGDNGVVESEVINTFLALESRLAAGARHTCVADGDGALSCWGSDAFGQFGDGQLTNPSAIPQPVPVPGYVTDVAANNRNTCARSPDGNLWCWGWNAYGQVGTGTTAPVQYPQLVGGPLAGNTAQIAAGDRHNCATSTNGTAWCWGYNPEGNLGDGTRTDRSAPVQVSGLEGVVRVTAGTLHSCALKNDGTVWCWGANNYGQLDDGANARSKLPVEVALTSPAVDVCASAFSSCALDAAGVVRCWGRNDLGVLGTGSFTVQSTIGAAQLPQAAKSIACGHHHACAVLADGSAWCWGFNGYGQVGDGTANNRSVPALVLNLPSRVEELVAGTYHTCASIEDGSTWCWGDNSQKQLGLGISGSPIVSPRRVHTFLSACGDGVCGDDETPVTCPADCQFTDGIQRVTALVLVDTRTGVDIQTIQPGDELLLDHFPIGYLSIRAVTYPSTVGSVRFGFDGNQNYRTESGAPYALGGDASGVYAPVNFETGQRIITATPYTMSGAGGEEGEALVVNFNVRATTDHRVTSFVLVDPVDDTDIMPLVDGSVISLGALPTPSYLSIRAETNPSPVGSVRFSLDSDSYTRLENGVPYALGGDSAGDYGKVQMEVGVHTLLATPFTHANGGGASGIPLTITFVVTE